MSLTMAAMISQDQAEVNIPPLEDPEDYHLYVAYSGSAEDQQVAQRIIADLTKIKCLNFDIASSSASQMNAIENGVDRCKGFLLILSKAFIDSDWLRFLCAIMQKKARERSQPNATIVVRVGDVSSLDDVAVPSIVRDVYRDSQVLEADDAEFVKNIYRFLSLIKYPAMDVLPVSNVAIGLAWTFYYGYLQMLLPGLPGRIREYEKTWQQTPGERVMSRKAFLIIPVSCFCPPSLTKVDELFVALPDNKIRYEATRAGSPKRNYDLPVYKVNSKEPGEQTYYVQIQFATPILTMYEMYKGQIAGMREQDLHHQMHLFCYYLRSILRHSQTSSCHDRTIIICYDLKDKETNPLSSIVRERIKLEIKSETEADAIQNCRDANPIPETDVGLRGVTYEEIAVSNINANPIPETDVGLRGVTYEENAVSNISPGRQLLPRYAMKEKKRGKALILSVRRNRQGAEADEGILKQLWEELEFEVDLRINPTAKDMENVVAANLSVNHMQCSALVCCILSHGYLGSLKGSDDDHVKITDLTYLLNNDLCPGLAGKPKMFFIVACQNDQDSSERGSGIIKKDSSIEDDASLAGNRATLVPGSPDFLMSYATLPGGRAYRHPETGTFYIRALTDKIRKHRKEPDMDLESILKHVSTQVLSQIKPLVASAEERVVTKEQFPFCLTTMNKLIFL